ncbi:hypothetical protein [Polyangium sp. 6x1]|uniref:hypothetical protein n=1 Tax=Polyangium sp. 6x1 TaxID=3042689 RepID=UPI0024829178|nr:hypothetical protein [Polyangium sp. 6x1]MDI1442968.1 hypothetical protein [Polyangium sp. 6x1]
MLKHIAAAALVSTFALGATAFAQGAGQNAGLKQLSWQQLQSACQNPAAFQSQRQPNAIRLTCEDTQLVWEAEQTDNVEMDNSRQITASLSSDKYYIIRQDQAVPMSVSQTMCPRFKEVQVSFTQSFSLSCQEIQSFQGNMNDFCKARLDSAVKGNQQLATRTATGRVYDMCAAPALVNEPPKAPAQPAQPSQPAAPAQSGGGKAAPAAPAPVQPVIPSRQLGARRPGIGGQLPVLPGLAGRKSR